jgi:hypothetical protein
LGRWKRRGRRIERIDFILQQLGVAKSEAHALQFFERHFEQHLAGDVLFPAGHVMTAKGPQRTIEHEQ